MWRQSLPRAGAAGLFFASLACLVAFTGCKSSTSESYGADEKAKNIGTFSAAPSGVYKPKVGIPSFTVKSTGGIEGNLDALAADEMSTLLYQTGRFKVIERGQLQKLLDEQNLEGIVKPGELAKTGQVRGVDYLLLGKVTNLR